MNSRERFLETMRFGKPDRAFMLYPWLWTSTLERWHSEGLPPDVHVDEYFGTDRYEVVPINVNLLPNFEREVLREDGEFRVVRRPDGQLIKEFKHRPDLNMPTWLDFPLKNRDDWEREFKPRLDPRSPARYPIWWDDYARSVRDRDYPLAINAGSFFGWIRNWMGLERLSLTFYDDPGLVRDMMDYLGWHICETIHRALDTVQFDFALMWEDMACKAGPLCHPKQFREFMLPNYKKVTQLLREHGIDIIMVDSDGNNGPLIPLWIEGGVTGLFPMEVAAGSDCIAYRKQFGKSLMIYGGIDKRALAAGKDETEIEVLSKVPWLLTQGGYIPWVDHLVPPDVPFVNFCYYQELISRVSSNPEKALSEARRRGISLE